MNKVSQQTLILLGFFLFFFALKWGQLLFLPLTVSFFIYSLFTPLLERMTQRFKISKQLSSIIIILVATLSFWILFIPVLSGLKALIKDLSEYNSILLSMKEPLTLKAQELGLDFSTKGLVDILEGLPLGSFLQSTTALVSEIATIGFFVFLFITFMFLEPGVLKKNSFLGDVSFIVRSFFWSKTIVAVMSAATIGVFLALLGIPYALMFAILTLILSFVPAIGQVLGSLLPLPLVYLIHPGWGFMLIVFLVPNLIQSFYENFVWPKFIKDTLGLHPLSVLASLIFWTLIWGVLGAFFAIPLTAIIRYVCEKDENLTPIAKVLRGQIS